MKKLFITCIALFLASFMVTSIYAANDWWGAADTFFDGINWTKQNLSSLDSVINLIKILGNAVFIIVAIVLGIKYILGSAEGKTDVKEGLISLTVAMIFFYGWSALETILVSGNQLIWIKDTDASTIASVYDTIVYFLNFVAVGALIYVGIKYLMSGAEGKADLKGKGVPFVIGMIMTFATLTFLNFLRTIIGEII